MTIAAVATANPPDTDERGVRLLPGSYRESGVRAAQRGRRKPAAEMNANGTGEGSQAMEVDSKPVEAAMAGGGGTG